MDNKPMHEESHFERADRDLLIAIDTKLTTIINKSDDHETRIRRLELGCAIFIGLGYALQFYFNFLRA